MAALGRRLAVLLSLGYLISLSVAVAIAEVMIDTYIAICFLILPKLNGQYHEAQELQSLAPRYLQVRRVDLGGRSRAFYINNLF
ncbi:hypothetical protein TorRG33x02_098250 [Trema orientale]|uniref:Uncharacterized protein n=1 Tax=Trema orientale TaxID=63057 RepID=A0A2P5F987_TREOI|nr:hypothetical protein TorRG33x02_098250 [Trema orientale]